MLFRAGSVEEDAAAPGLAGGSLAVVSLFGNASMTIDPPAGEAATPWSFSAPPRALAMENAMDIEEEAGPSFVASPRHNASDNIDDPFAKLLSRSAKPAEEETGPAAPLFAAASSLDPTSPSGKGKATAALPPVAAAATASKIEEKPAAATTTAAKHDFAVPAAPVTSVFNTALENALSKAKQVEAAGKAAVPFAAFSAGTGGTAAPFAGFATAAATAVKPPTAAVPAAAPAKAAEKGSVVAAKTSSNTPKPRVLTGPAKARADRLAAAAASLATATASKPPVIATAVNTAASSSLLSPEERPSRRVPTMAHKRVSRALNALVQGGEKQTPAAAAPAPKESVVKDDSVCRPWDRADFMLRLRSFTIPWWFAKPDCLSPIECARHGWCNTGVDLLSCKVCGTSLAMSTPVELASESSRKPDSVAHRLALSLSSSHAAQCGWRDNPCHPTIPQATAAAPEAALAAFQKRYEGIAGAGIKPALGGRGLQELAATATLRETRAEEFPNLSAALLALVGWSAVEGGNLQCDYCNRTLAPRFVRPLTIDVALALT